MKPKVLVTRGDHDPDAIARLAQTCDVEVCPEPRAMTRSELLKGVVGKDALLILPHDKMDEDLIKTAGPQLKVVSTHSVGYDHINQDLMKNHGIKVGYTPGVLTNDVADLSVCLTLMTMRRVKEHVQTIVDDTWKNANASPFWLVGSCLADKTIGIMGLGRIGLATAKRLKAFEPAKIIYTATKVKDEADGLAEMVSFDQLLNQSDIIIITASFNESTKGIFNKDAFAKMKKTAFIVNTSRGGLINQPDLIQALKDGNLAGAGLDVMTPEPIAPDHELVKMPNVFLTPHIASSTRETRLKMINLAVDNILAGLKGDPMPSRLC